MVVHGILMGWDNATYTADIQLSGSLTTYLDHVHVSRGLADGDMVVGSHVIVAVPGGQPKDACVVAVFTV